MEKRKKILVLFPTLSGGGAQMVCAWIIQALKEDAEVHLATFDNSLPPISELNDFYGTSLEEKDLIHHEVSLIRVKGKEWGPMKSIYIRQKLLARYAHCHKNDYDLFISGFGHMFLPAPSMAYIHFPQFKTTPPDIRKLGGLPDSFLRRMYRKAIDTLFSLVFKVREPDVLICNSEWTAGCIRKAWGVNAQVIYPPVVNLAFPEKSWVREPGRFCCVSRIHPEKELHWLFEIGERLQARNTDFSVDLISGGKVDTEYRNELEPRIRKASGWLKIHQNVPRSRLNELLHKATFGIHCKQGEHFGIAVAEMVCCGVIPFIRNDGGCLEIVDFKEQCIYGDADDAVEKILHLFSTPSETELLREHLKEHSRKFSEIKFMESIRLECVPLLGREYERT